MNHLVLLPSLVLATALTAAPAPAQSLLAGTYLGGTGGDEEILIIRPAPNGDLVVAGETSANGFPVTANAYQPGRTGKRDLFVARLSPDGSQLLWATYLGGSNDEDVGALQVVADGSVWLAGTTTSQDFPVTPDAWQGSRNAGSDAFVARLDAGGSQFLYGTYLGQGSWDRATGLHVDTAARTVHVGGRYSGSVPPATTPSGYDPSGGSSDAFYAILDRSVAGTTSLAYGTAFGGGNVEQDVHMEVDANGIVTLGGITKSTDLPTTTGAYRTSPTASGSVFVARLDPAQSGTAGLLYSSYYGGDGSDGIEAVGTDGAGRITFCGRTYSTNLPATANAYDPNDGAGYDGYVARIDPALTGTPGLVYSSYVATSQHDDVHCAHVDPAGRVVLDMNDGLPTTPGAFMARRGPIGVRNWIGILDPSLSGASGLVYATYYGRCTNTGHHHHSVWLTGTELLVAGDAKPGSQPFTANAWQPTGSSGNDDGFVGRVDATVPGTVTSNFGSACPGSVGVPALGLGDHPELCLSYRVRATNLPPSELGVFYLGLDNQSWNGQPLPYSLNGLGAPGCNLYVSPDRGHLALTGTGTAVWKLTIPDLPALVGERFYVQYLFIDDNANSLGAAATEGGMFQVGW